MSSWSDRSRTAVRGLGQLLITLGVILLLFVVYDLWWTNLYTNHEQTVLRKQLQHAWAVAPPVAFTDPLNGAAIAILRIPVLGPGWVKVVVQGVTHDDLEKGPGHVPGTALPGQVGDFVVSGHRTTWGAPFNQLNLVHRGDAIVVETRAYWYTYDVTSTEVVLPDDVAAIAPVPDHPGAAPHLAMITLTTCTPEFSATNRLVVHGRLVSTLSKSAGLPPALHGQVG
jgi:sortase A